MGGLAPVPGLGGGAIVAWAGQGRAPDGTGRAAGYVTPGQRDLLLGQVKQVRGIGGNGREWPGWAVGRERPKTLPQAGLDQFRTNSCKLHGMPCPSHPRGLYSRLPPYRSAEYCQRQPPPTTGWAHSIPDHPPGRRYGRRHVLVARNRSLPVSSPRFLSTPAIRRPRRCVRPDFGLPWTGLSNRWVERTCATHQPAPAGTGQVALSVNPPRRTELMSAGGPPSLSPPGHPFATVASLDAPPQGARPRLRGECRR